MLITETGIPDEHIALDEWGGETMLRLEDGWCSALDRETSMCSIYKNRPWICREFEMGSYECCNERAVKEVASPFLLTYPNPPLAFALARRLFPFAINSAKR